MFQHADPEEGYASPPKINGPCVCPLNRGHVVANRAQGWHWYDIVTVRGKGKHPEDNASHCACGLSFWFDLTVTIEEE